MQNIQLRPIELDLPISHIHNPSEKTGKWREDFLDDFD